MYIKTSPTKTPLEVEGLEEVAAVVPEVLPEGRDDKGRFKKGFRPPVHYKKNVTDFAPALNSIQRAFPSEKIGDMMLEVYETALRVRSAKAALAVLELALAYQFGRPVARMLSVSSTLDEFRELFSGEGEEEVIDVELDGGE